MSRPSIVGICDAESGKVAPRTTLDLATEVATGALADAGLPWTSVDGMIASVPLVGPFPRHAAALAEAFGVTRQMEYVSSISLGGASNLAAILEAFRVVASGLCDVALVVAADTPRTGQDRRDTVEMYASMRHPVYEQPVGLTNVSAYALLAQYYLATNELPLDALYAIPPLLRENARTHEGAVYRDVITTDDVAASKLVSSPLRLLECSPVCDGAAAAVVARDELASSLHPPIYLYGQGYGQLYDHLAYAPGLERTGCSLAATRAYERARMTPSNVDVALVYDSYSISFALELEELGFCPPGKASEMVLGGAFGKGGQLPINPHGGLLSHGHCGGAAGAHHITEAVRQLRQIAENQVAGAETALVHAEGGIMSTNLVALLGGDPSHRENGVVYDI